MLYSMKERLLTNWTVVRVIYTLLGIIVTTQSIMTHQWFASIFGLYFKSMGVFGFGCAAGQCHNITFHQKPQTKESIEDVSFEEVKTK